MVVVLGDRYEALSVTIAATFLGIPVAHIHGGEASQGAIDDSFRNAITAMAHLHFPTAAPYARRIRQMGAQPGTIHLVGAPALDNLARLVLLERTQLAAELDLSLDAPLMMVTYHPVTTHHDDPAAGIDTLLAALAHFPETSMVISGANQDAGGRVINARLQAFAGQNPQRVRLVTSLGSLRYLSVLKQAAVVVGNSASGIIEAPAAGAAVVNVGPRQDGRLRSPAVIDCPEDEAALVAAITQALSPSFQAVAKRAESPFGEPGGSALIARTLASVPLESLGRKVFHDLPGDGAWT